MARTGTQKSFDRAREIYLTAAQVFFEKGFEAASLNDVAEALNITKAALYYYVESKQDLLFQIMNLGLGRIENEVISSAKEITDAEERLKHIVFNFSYLVAGGNPSVIIVSDHLRALTPEQRESIVTSRRLLLEFLRTTLEELKTEGKLNDVNLTTAAFTISGMILWLPRWFNVNGKISTTEACRDITKMALRGLLRDPLEI